MKILRCALRCRRKTLWTKGEFMKKRKIDLDDVAIICGLLSIIINVAFSGKELLANVRWLLSYLGL